MSPRVKAEDQFAALLDLTEPPPDAAGDESLVAMMSLATALRSAGESPALPVPDAEFRDVLRQRLVAVATVQAGAPTEEHGRRRIAFTARRRITALAGSFAVVVSVAGVGVAASRSLPGQPLYDVKRATEAVQLWTARGSEAKGRRHLEFAQTRLAEIKKLPPNSSHIASTLTSMNAETKAGTAELISSYQSSHSTAPLATLVTFTKAQVTGLNTLASTLPATLHANEVASLQLLGGVATQVKKVAGGTCILCGPNGGTTAPTNSPTPKSKPSSHPSKHPSNKPGGKASKHPHSTSPSKHPSAHPTKRPGTSTSPSTKPTPPSILPTGILSTILHPKHPKSSKSPAPIPSIVSSILGGLGLG